MRKLKLQMQTTIDGFVAGPEGEMDWMTRNFDDDELTEYINLLAGSSDTILMGRKMADGFVDYWIKLMESSEGFEYEIAKKMVDYPKVVFTKTLEESPWANTVLAKGDLAGEVTELKNQTGKDLIVYGGAGFVTSLIEENLIDEYYFFVNPAAIGKGMRIFDRLDSNFSLTLVKSRAFDCGVVVNRYEPAG